MKTLNSLEFTVQPEEAGQRLDRYLAQLEEVSSRSYAQMLIEKNFVLLDEKLTKPSTHLKSGQKITLHLPPIEPSELQPYHLALDIVFEDSDIIVVNKPSGLVVHPAAGHQQDTLVNALLAHTKQLSMKNEQRPGIVHRIDKETSGLLVIAKNDFSHEHLSLQFKNKTTHRVYHAITDKIPNKKRGTCQSYLARHLRDRKKYASVRENNSVVSQFQGDLQKGKWAVTHFEVKATQGHRAYIELKLETGRTHQIRVHMSELGCCLLGDVLYGYSVKKMKELSVERFFLHATELGFVHPRDHRELHFKVKWPEKDQIFIQSLGFSDAVF